MKAGLLLGIGVLCGVLGASGESQAAQAEGSSVLELMVRGDATAEALCRSHCNVAHASCLLEVATLLREAQEQLTRCTSQANSNREHDERECNSRHSQNPPELRRCLERAAEDHRLATASCNATFDTKKREADKKADKCNTDQDACIAACKGTSGTPTTKAESAFSDDEIELMSRDFLREQLDLLETVVEE